MNRKLTPPPDTTVSAPEAPMDVSGPSPRVLIVDDDPMVCGLYTLVLEQEGYETVTAENGEDGLAQLACGHFDLVITDCAMPILDGPGMIQALRLAGYRMPVIMISGSYADSPTLPAVADEICVTLSKPTHNQEILAAVVTALQISPNSERPHSLPVALSSVASAPA